MDKIDRFSRTAIDLVLGAGAVKAGIATTETLLGGPESTDLTYLMPEARSAVVFALPLDQAAIESFLKKEDMAAANRDNHRVNTMAAGVSLELSEYLNMKGFNSIPVIANAVYRKDVPGGAYSELPPLSHRYLAVRSGVGHFGLSGNVITREHGAAVILGSVVTAAVLNPTEPLPPDDNYCDNCKLCIKGCASGLMDDKNKTTVTIGGVEFSYAKRRAYTRCDYVCGGFTGLHSSGKWSTWSPARFPIPKNDDGFMDALMNAVEPYRKRPRQDFGCNIYHPLVPGNKLEFTCGHCQFICHPDKAVRARRYKMLKNSGVAIQEKDGRIRGVTPEEAERHLAAMDDETRALYE
ncbi:MAG: epoxyqueuosine reductase [Deltaproteobacteria bacterium]|nr:epoxyqueuosine reductase [Deltaproteobacteria bacterium]